MGGIVSSFFCAVVGTAFPIYASFKALETPGADDDTQWLTYWVVYAVFSLFENIADFLVSWIPFYFEMKIIALIGLQLPGPKLASVLYKTYIRPYLQEREGRIDHQIAHITENIIAQVKAALFAVVQTYTSKTDPNNVVAKLAATYLAPAEQQQSSTANSSTNRKDK
eukprot:TRINITY_DN1106_c0_g1_i1.p1 TRINITY_DN1106_c0_g1~~TRINITY_DN1106_c0_g1_i1.p1  ORF type:complete len:167 (+),score=27.78 TRINITY_DN1106_c0_g1_i1:54-554(+)